MSVFDLHTAVLDDYWHFVQSYFTVADDRARQYVEQALVQEARLWPEFLLQVSPSYVRPELWTSWHGAGNCTITEQLFVP